MKIKIKIFPTILLIIVMIFSFISISDSMNKPVEYNLPEIEEFTSVPDLSNYHKGYTRTQNFVEFLNPIIMFEQHRILSSREYLEDLIDKKNLTSSDSIWILQTAQYYKLRNFRFTPNNLNELHNRIDIIPTEIILSQAAIESNWGKSGFAKNNNNLFGMRTTNKATGVIPKKRAAGATFRIASYPSVNQSIRSYLRNLNTHSAYKKLRDNRAEMRKENVELDPFNLANGLTAYSTLGYDYVLMIKKTMDTYEAEFTKEIIK